MSRISAPVSRFGSDTSGGVAPMFGLLAVSLLMVSGLAIDVGRSVHASNMIAAGIDAAALAAAKTMRERNLSATEAKTIAASYLDANLKSLSGTFASVTGTPTIYADPTSGTVQIDIAAQIKTLFGGIIGVDNIAIPVTTVARIEGKDIEIGLQVDVTGSMDGNQGGKKKLDALKDAAKELVDTVVSASDAPQKIRLGIAPYSAGVNAGAYAKLVNGNRTNTCTYERSDTSYQASDTAPVGFAALKIPADLTNPQGCPSVAVEPMTFDKAVLKAQIDSFTSSGTTAGHLGTAWAWYLISPEWASVWPTAAKPAPYSDGKTIKVAILMTDGLYNTVGGKMSGANETLSSQFATDTCAAMKAKKIVVYTIGFGDGVTGAALATLKTCATDNVKFFLAKDPAQLTAAFQSIAKDITALRLTK